MSDSNLYTRTPQSIVLYGNAWCPDCRRSRGFFKRKNIEFIDVDIDQDKKAEAFVKEINHGNRSVPTIIFPDGSIFVEPSDQVLAQHLQIE